MINDTKVIPARLYGHKEETGAQIEILLLKRRENDIWECLVKPGKKARPGAKITFGDGILKGEIIDIVDEGNRLIQFHYEGIFEEILDQLGEMPLPSYIARPVEEMDADRYQNIFARNEGAVVTPAAGLHFSRELLKRMEIRGIDYGFLTPHSGLGNFREIDVEDLTKHKMDSEQMRVTPELVELVNHAKDEGRKVCAVGTSVMRGIESAVSTGGHIKTYDGWTNKFIFPPYDFTVATNLVTNFHMPLSTMLMMVAAFGGYDIVLEAYESALKEGYRFGAYGDAMLIL